MAEQQAGYAGVRARAFTVAERAAITEIARLLELLFASVKRSPDKKLLAFGALLVRRVSRIINGDLGAVWTDRDVMAFVRDLGVPAKRSKRKAVRHG